MPTEATSPRPLLRVVTASPATDGPPPSRDLRHLDGLVDEFFASGHASKKRGARRVLELMLGACHAEPDHFDGYWPIRACVEVYTYGPLDGGWGHAAALGLIGAFFRYAYEEDSLSARELLWLLCLLEQTRRRQGYEPRIPRLPETLAFQQARLAWARWEAKQLAEQVDAARAQPDPNAPLLLAAELLAARDGVPLRFEELDPAAYYTAAITQARSKGLGQSARHVESSVLPAMAATVERLASLYVLRPESAAQLADALRSLGGRAS